MVKKITLADIAREAEVAVKTASKVMKNDSSVRPYIKERVLSVAARLGYAPNMLAQALRNKSINIVSMHIAQLYNPFFGSIFENVAVELGRNGYMVVPCDGVDVINETNQRMMACATILTSTSPGKIKQVIQDGPVVSINASSPVLSLASDVSIDFKSGYIQLAKELIRTGFTSVVYFTPCGESRQNMTGKFQYVEKEFSDCGIVTYYQESNKVFHHEQEIVDYINKNPGKVNCVLCSNDIVAVRLIDCFYINKINYPDAIKVVGCDGTFCVSGMWTLHVDINLLAKAVVFQLMKTFKKTDLPHEQVLIETELIKK
jgi:LacI family transcriptional regulator